MLIMVISPFPVNTTEETRNSYTKKSVEQEIPRGFKWKFILNLTKNFNINKSCFVEWNFTSNCFPKTLLREILMGEIVSMSFCCILPHHFLQKKCKIFHLFVTKLQNKKQEEEQTER